jgi:DNA invertase Pin-like site-specific DNA recombinase
VAVSQTIGYARVSAADQNPQMQIDALEAINCDRIFVEKLSGALRDRPQLAAALEYIRSGDVLVVYKLDRLGRSLMHLVETVNGLAARGIGFRSLRDPIDTTTPSGKLAFHFFAAIAEFERDMIRERAAAGRAAAKARGETGGRPLSMTPDKLLAAKALLATKRTVQQAADSVGVARSTLYRHLKAEVDAKPSAAADGENEFCDMSSEIAAWVAHENASRNPRR